MNRNIITQKIIDGCIAGTDGGVQNAKVAKIIAIIMIVLGAICLILPAMFFFSIFCWGIAALCFVLRAHSLNIIREIQNKEYTLQVDTCINKGISRDTEGPDSPYIVFSKSGKCSTLFSGVILNSTAVVNSPDIFSTANIGDVFYLLRINKRQKQILYIFNTKYWYIDLNEFTQSGDRFIPNKL